MRPSLAMLAVLSTAFGLGAAAPPYTANLTLLTDPYARCMDGTPGGFYFHSATSPDSKNKWIIQLDGGGECADKVGCQNAINYKLGSSNFFAPYRWFNEYYLLLATEPWVNPDFATWNMVAVPYCSQDVHTGQRMTASPDTFGYYFSGHLIYKAILDALDKEGELTAATDIILAGASAGGIGVWPNLDYTAERYPKARTVGVAIAGFYFFAYPYQGVNHTQSGLADFRQAAWPGHVQLWDSFMDQSCMEHLQGESYACMLANYSFPYVASESFVVEAQTDQVVIEAHDWVPQQYVNEAPEQAYLAAWHQNMTIGLAPLMDPTNPRNGVFNPACFIHTSFNYTNPLIDGKNFYTAVGDWYFRRTPPSQYKLADNCGVMCNPTCPNPM